MQNHLLKLIHILDGLPMTKLQRAEAGTEIQQIDSKYQELSQQIEELRNEIEKLKQPKK